MNKTLNRLRGLRAQNGLTQADMAKLLKINTSSYNKREVGEIDFKLEEAKIIADQFGESIENIFYCPEVYRKETREGA